MPDDYEAIKIEQSETKDSQAVGHSHDHTRKYQPHVLVPW